MREAPFFVLERGRVDFIDRKPGKDVYIAEADGGTFIGDIAVFTGEPTISACVAVEPTDVIEFSRAKLRKMVAMWPEFGEHTFETLLARRAWHEAEGIERFRGAGVHHAAVATDAERRRDEDVIVVGGGNSAGQAAVHLARSARSVRIVVRGTALSTTMSHYLVDRIERSPDIEVMTETEVAAVDGTATVESVRLRDRRTGDTTQVAATAVYVMIGATPCTEAVSGVLALDPAGYLLCGSGAAACSGLLAWPLKDREPHLLETVRPGVFTAGDVRAGASNRVAGAVGDGALAVRFAHQMLADRG